MTKQIQLTEEQLKNLKAFLDRVTLSGFEIASYNDLVIALFHSQPAEGEGSFYPNPFKVTYKDLPKNQNIKWGNIGAAVEQSSSGSMQIIEDYLKGSKTPKLGKDVDANA